MKINRFVMIAMLTTVLLFINNCSMFSPCNTQETNAFHFLISVHNDNASVISSAFHLYDIENNEVMLEKNIGTKYVSFKSDDLGYGVYIISSAGNKAIKFEFDVKYGDMAFVDCFLPGEDSTFKKISLDSIMVGELLYQCRTTINSMACD